MMLDMNRNGMDAKQGGGIDDENGCESHRLLPASAASPPRYHDTLLNDLTYSDDDDDEADDRRAWDALELGGVTSGSISSPDTAALLDGIQNDVFPTQEQSTQRMQRDQQRHLMHPLAREESDNDDTSYLAYSITSSHAESDMLRNSTEDARQAAMTAVASYGSLDAAPPDFRPRTTAAVTFRPPSPVFERSPRKGSDPKRPRRDSAPGRSSARPKSARADDSRARRPRRPPADRGDRPPATPAPPAISESPVTSATATDDAKSPAEGGGRVARRRRRLRRVRRAAEAREAAVREVRGAEQDPKGCNDAAFAVAFLCQLLLVSVSALAFGQGALVDRIHSIVGGDAGDGEGDDAADVNPFAGLQTDDVIITDSPLELLHYGGGAGAEDAAPWEDETHDISPIDYINVMKLVCVASGFASLCSLLALGFMMMLSKNMLHATLVFAIGASLAWTVLGWAFGSYYVLPLAGVVASSLSVVYAVVVWDRISFAATNLSVALKGMRSMVDIPLVGLCVLATTFLWTILWIFAFVGTFDFLNDLMSNNWMSVVVVFFLFSYYWTFQVIKGISQTTVASIVGKWWDTSEEDALPVCSGVLHRTISRNILASFGSICLGSLVVGPCTLVTRISTFSRLAGPRLNGLASPHPLRNPDAGDASPPEAPREDGVVSRNVNRWSFTYVGLYGYGFWESGGRASRLFEARGWTQVVSDDLIVTAMAMSSMIIGASTACLGLIVEEVDGYSFTSLNKPIMTAFLISLFVGFSLSSAFLSIIEGSVNAILVCYASAPVEFHANHHKLSEEMKGAWKHFWLQKPTNGKRRQTSEVHGSVKM